MVTMTRHIFTEKAGIQVKQSENIGRNVVDNFETALNKGEIQEGVYRGLWFYKRCP